jgi:nucleoside-diphosphate-sugar epimerase
VWHLPTDPQQITGKQMIDLFATEMYVPSKVTVLPVWMIRIIGLFSPFMGEMPEMMYQYDRDYFFDSSKFDRRFNFTPTPYADGVKQTVAEMGKVL